MKQLRLFLSVLFVVILGGVLFSSSQVLAACVPAESCGPSCGSLGNCPGCTNWCIDNHSLGGDGCCQYTNSTCSSDAGYACNFCSCTANPTPTNTPVPNNVYGYHDAYGNSPSDPGTGINNQTNQTQANCVADGWAVDPNNVGQDVNVRVLSDGVVRAGPLLASNARGDLTGICTSGTCGYRISLGSLITAGVNHTIQVQAQDLNTGAWVNLRVYNTAVGPRTLNCAVVPTLTPTPTRTPTPTPSATPSPTPCALPAAPVSLTVSAQSCPSNTRTLDWSDVAGATSYAFRLDENYDSWVGISCATPQNPGDSCLDGLPVSPSSRSVTSIQGRTYKVWVHAVNSCGYSPQAQITFTHAACPTNTPTPTPSRTPTPSATPSPTPAYWFQVNGGEVGAGVTGAGAITNSNIPGGQYMCTPLKSTVAKTAGAVWSKGVAGSNATPNNLYTSTMLWGSNFASEISFSKLKSQIEVYTGVPFSTSLVVPTNIDALSDITSACTTTGDDGFCYAYASGDTTISAPLVITGTKIVLVVDGVVAGSDNLIINGAINEAGGGAANTAFVAVVKGQIRLSPSLGSPTYPAPDPTLRGWFFSGGDFIGSNGPSTNYVLIRGGIVSAGNINFSNRRPPSANPAYYIDFHPSAFFTSNMPGGLMQRKRFFEELNP
jgi:hypothetical protein